MTLADSNFVAVNSSAQIRMDGKGMVVPTVSSDNSKKGDAMTPDDTSRDAANVQVAVWRRMSGEQRVAMAFELSENVRQIAAEGVRRRHPDYSDDEVRLAVIRLQLGNELFQAAFPGCEVTP